MWRRFLYIMDTAVGLWLLMFAIGNIDDWRLTMISKNVRKIFILFGLEEPQLS